MQQEKRPQIDFIPKVCIQREEQEPVLDAQGNATDEVKTVIVEPTFSGKIRVIRPTIDERYEFIEECGIDSSRNGVVEMKRGGLATVRAMIKASKKFYVSVELKRLSDGLEFKSLEELEVEPDCDTVMLEVARELRYGFKPSKN